jgi:tRNA pseudouridine38-40 synthase
MRTIKLTLEYDGTDFVGWQRQRSGRSVQAVVEDAVLALTQAPARVVGAGRTDAGVHALGQVGHFRTESSLPTERIAAGLNALLPRDVSVRSAEDAQASFHARYDARFRVYRYLILRRAAPSALLGRYVYHFWAPLNLGRMKDALGLMEGTNDFRAFRALGTITRTTQCTLAYTDLTHEGDLLNLTFGGDRFLRHMVRMLVGTLLRVGRGTLEPKDVAALLTAGADGIGGPAAPPQGLHLLHVGY